MMFLFSNLGSPQYWGFSWELQKWPHCQNSSGLQEALWVTCSGYGMDWWHPVHWSTGLIIKIEAAAFIYIYIYKIYKPIDHFV